MPNRLRILIAVVALAACGGRSVPGSSSKSADHDAGEAQPPPLLKVSQIEIQTEGGQIWISIIDETGSSDLIDVGKFEGECAAGVDTGGDPEIVKGAVFAVDCVREGQGLQLRFLHRDPDMVVLRAPVGSSSYEMYRRIGLPRIARPSCFSV
jgi:hypothetical protein